MEPHKTPLSHNFKLKVTHANAPSAQPRLKNVIFRHYYVMQKQLFY